MSILKIWTLIEVNSGIIAHPQTFLDHKQARMAYIDRANEICSDAGHESPKHRGYITINNIHLFYNEIEISNTPTLDEIEIPLDGIPFQKHDVTEWMVDNKNGIIADGFIPNSADDGIYMTEADQGRMLRYVIKIEDGSNWAIYVDWSYKSPANVAVHGQKVIIDDNILKLVNCTPEVLKMYRK